jgi:hypothetical protein
MSPAVAGGVQTSPAIGVSVIFVSFETHAPVARLRSEPSPAEAIHDL